MFRFYSFGSESEKEGLTLGINYDDPETGDFIGLPEPEKRGYKCKEITFEEFKEYRRRDSDPDEPRGWYGLVNMEGLEAAEKATHMIKERLEKEEQELADFVAKRVARQVEQGVVLEEEIPIAVKAELKTMNIKHLNVLDTTINVQKNVVNTLVNPPNLKLKKSTLALVESEASA